MKAATKFLISLAVTAALTTSVAAQVGFQPVTSKSEFIQLVIGKNLKYSGASIHLTAGGKIQGRAYGKKVSGTWDWKGGYFCRSIMWGSRDLGPNCEAVKVDGQTLRFITDHGKGKRADMSLR